MNDENRKNLSVGLVQHSCGTNRDENIAASIAGIRDAAGLGAQLVLLQELHVGPYFCQTERTEEFDQAETIPGPSTKLFAELAKDLDVVLVLSLFERRAAGIYHNTAVVLERDGSIAGKYRKMHIPDDPGYYEKFYFTPGDLGFKPITTSLGSLGVLVCWDQWYPEASRLMALAGADLLLYPTAIGWAEEDDQAEQDRQLDAWATVQRSHAIANGLPVLSCNRTGFEPDPSKLTGGIHFWGHSFICGPQGEMLAQANAISPGILVTTLDMQRVESVRRIWPYLRDRRIDAYGDLDKRLLD